MVEIKMSRPKPPKNHGGKREGAGRKPDWLKEKCAGLIDRNKLLEFVASVASGDETEKYFDKVLGRAVEVPCSTKDRLHAVELLLERGYGKAPQAIQHDVQVQGRFVLVCPE